jgi:hypothetical protein
MKKFLLGAGASVSAPDWDDADDEAGAFSRGPSSAMPPPAASPHGTPSASHAAAPVSPAPLSPRSPRPSKPLPPIPLPQNRGSTQTPRSPRISPRPQGVAYFSSQASTRDLHYDAAESVLREALDKATGSVPTVAAGIQADEFSSLDLRGKQGMRMAGKTRA